MLPLPNDEVDLAQHLARLAAGKPLRVVDLFAGCGGMSLGFQSAGFQILGAVERDEHAVRTHALNLFPSNDPEAASSHNQPQDITQITPDDFARDVLHAKTPANQVDVVIGGPPCQAFARIGRAKLRQILQHPQAFLSDKRASLYIDFLEFVEVFQPLAVVMENVPEIMNFGGQNVAEEIAVSLEGMGYCPRYTILNAVNFGVPEMRQRFFLIALKSGLNLEPTFPQPTHYIKPSSGYESAKNYALSGVDKHPGHYVRAPMPSVDLPMAVTAEEAIGDLPPIPSHLLGSIKPEPRLFQRFARYRDNHPPSEYATAMRTWPGFEGRPVFRDHITRYLPRDHAIFAAMLPGEEYPKAHERALKMFAEQLLALEAKRGVKIAEDSDEYRLLRKSIVPPYSPGKFPNKWHKMERDRPSRTLTAHMGKDTYSHIHYDSEQARVISVREAARLQSFPDGFRFAGSMNSAFRQIGNAVPPLLARALALHVQSLLREVAVIGWKQGELL